MKIFCKYGILFLLLGSTIFSEIKAEICSTVSDPIDQGRRICKTIQNDFPVGEICFPCEKVNIDLNKLCNETFPQECHVGRCASTFLVSCKRSCEVAAECIKKCHSEDCKKDCH